MIIDMHTLGDDALGGDHPGAGSDGGRRRRRAEAAQAAARAGGLVSLAAVLLGAPQLTAQSHAVRVDQAAPA